MIAVATAVMIVAAPASGEWFCDDFETDLWTFGHENPLYDGTWKAEYTELEAHTPVRSIRTWLVGGGTSGNDADVAYAVQEYVLPAGSAVDSLTVWYNSGGIIDGGTGPGGPFTLVAACVEVYALDAGGVTLDDQVYCVACHDDWDDGWEYFPGWIYQEERPNVYEPGAPYYCRQADGSIRPEEDWWYRLKVHPTDDLGVNWMDVTSFRVRLVVKGTLLHLDGIKMFWDDFCYHLGVASPVRGSTWGRIKALMR
jgi:hypothetical protein